jgi:Cdc6-like AAA superfamily ATPase
METDQLVFLQDSAGTGRTSAVRKLIKTLQSHSKKCLIYGTTGTAALPYPGRTTLHSQSRPGTDKQLAGSS